jgi:hypothetical protein
LCFVHTVTKLSVVSCAASATVKALLASRPLVLDLADGAGGVVYDAFIVVTWGVR